MIPTFHIPQDNVIFKTFPNKRNAFLMVLLATLAGTVAAEDLAWRYRSIEVIDTPTADVVDHYGYYVSFRFGQDGNLQTKTAFGLLPRLNLGFGLDGERVLGTEKGRLNKPTINLKFRFFDGTGIIPAFAMGYDGQGYVFSKPLDEYEQREKGFYLAATSEIFVPNMMLSYGVNRFDFDHGDATRGFVGWSYTYLQVLGFLAEVDHIGDYDERRINYGLKYFVTPVFTVDVAGRNIPERFGASNRVTERIIRLGYTGSF